MNTSILSNCDIALVVWFHWVSVSEIVNTMWNDTTKSITERRSSLTSHGGCVIHFPILCVYFKITQKIPSKQMGRKLCLCLGSSAL